MEGHPKKLMGSGAGCGGIKPALSIVIQNRQTSHPSRCPMYEVCCDKLVCGLIGGATLAILRGSEAPFAYGRVETPNASPQAIELNPRCSGKPIPRGLESALRLKTWSTDVRLDTLRSICNSSAEPRACLVQLGHLIVSAQQAQMGVQTSVSPGAHRVTQLVDRVKYGLGPGYHTWRRRVSLPSSKALLTGCPKGLAGGPLA